jgi:hypothetical protein
MCTSQIGAGDGISSGAAQQDLISYLMGAGASGDTAFSGSDPTVSGSGSSALPPASGSGLVQDSGSGSSIIVGGSSGLLGGGTTDIVFH